MKSPKEWKMAKTSPLYNKVRMVFEGGGEKLNTKSKINKILWNSDNLSAVLKMAPGLLF